MDEIERIRQLIIDENIIGQTGTITFNFAGFHTTVYSKDVIGNTIQDWFGFWLIEHGLVWNTGIHSQSWPDFILSDGSHLEVKTFNSLASPNFDIANFDAFIRSLWDGDVHRLDTPHLVFSYIFNEDNGLITINNFWIKNMWELTGTSPTNIMSLQVKQNQPVNIRPKNWRNPNLSTFSTRQEFVLALSQVVLRFRPLEFPNWYDVVRAHYERDFNTDL